MSALLSSFAASLQEEEEQALTTQSDLSFTPRRSLWEHVSSLLQPAERNEANAVIGSSVILDNQQLHSEVRSLLDIVTCLQTAHTPLTYAASTTTSVSNHPTANGIPPLRLRGFAADRTGHLKDEIAALIAAIRDKALQRGDSDTSRIWTPKSEREKSILSMVEKESAATSRSLSRSSRCSTARPSTASTARSTSSMSASASRPVSSSTASLTSSVASLSSLSIFTLDSAVTRIQAALQEEREELLRDIDYLRSIVEDEEQQAEERRQVEHESVMAPSDMELRALNKQLKAAVAEEESAERTRRLLSTVPDKATFRAAHKPFAPVGAMKAELVQRKYEQAASEKIQPLPDCANLQNEESVQSMLSSLDDLDPFFSHRSDPQPAAASTPLSASMSLTSPLPHTTPLPPPLSNTSPRSPTGVFTIRSSSSSSLHSSTVSSPRATRASPLPKIRVADTVSKSVYPRRMKLRQVVT